jgi:hypothetical protein
MGKLRHRSAPSPKLPKSHMDAEENHDRVQRSFGREEQDPMACVLFAGLISLARAPSSCSRRRGLARAPAVLMRCNMSFRSRVRTALPVDVPFVTGCWSKRPAEYSA